MFKTSILLIKSHQGIIQAFSIFLETFILITVYTYRTECDHGLGNGFRALCAKCGITAIIVLYICQKFHTLVNDFLYIFFILVWFQALQCHGGQIHIPVFCVIIQGKSAICFFPFQYVIQIFLFQFPVFIGIRVIGI